MSQLDATPAELLEEAGIAFTVFKHPSVVSFADVVEQLASRRSSWSRPWPSGVRTTASSWPHCRPV
jgi:hypothetical protein